MPGIGGMYCGLHFLVNYYQLTIALQICIPIALFFVKMSVQGAENLPT